MTVPSPKPTLFGLSYLGSKVKEYLELEIGGDGYQVRLLFMDNLKLNLHLYHGVIPTESIIVVAM